MSFINLGLPKGGGGVGGGGYEGSLAGEGRGSGGSWWELRPKP